MALFSNMVGVAALLEKNTPHPDMLAFALIKSIRVQSDLGAFPSVANSPLIPIVSIHPVAGRFLAMNLPVADIRLLHASAP